MVDQLERTPSEIASPTQSESPAPVSERLSQLPEVQKKGFLAWLKSKLVTDNTDRPRYDDNAPLASQHNNVAIQPGAKLPEAGPSNR